MKKRMKKNWKVLFVSLLVVYVVAFAGSFFTSKNTNTSWYSSITNSLTPPNWLFSIIWNVLFFLIALSLYFSWISEKKKKQKIKIAWVFGTNFLLNILWCVLFFGLKKTNLAFFELILLWISILLMIYTTWKINQKSAWLLVPYALWVGFAGILNYLIAFG